MTVAALRKRLRALGGLEAAENAWKKNKTTPMQREDYCRAIRRQARKTTAKRVIAVLGATAAATIIGVAAVRASYDMKECLVDQKVCLVTFTPPKDVRNLYELTRDMLEFFRTKLIQKKVRGGFAACCGTVIGAIRHGGLIPWDDDNDFYITPSFYEYLKSSDVRDAAREAGYKIDTTFDTNSKIDMMNTSTLKFLRAGHHPLKDSFVDLVKIVPAELKHGSADLPEDLWEFLPPRAVAGLKRGNRTVLTYPKNGLATLRKINPGGNPLNDALLQEDGEWTRDAKTGEIRLLTKDFMWYDLSIPCPGDGYTYMRRVFTPHVFTTAVVRVSVPGVSHKFIDAPGYYQIPAPYAPTMKSDGTVKRPGQAAELRTRERWLKEGALPSLVNYWGGDREFFINKN